MNPIPRVKSLRVFVAAMAALLIGLFAVSGSLRAASAAELPNVVDPTSIKVTNSSGSTDVGNWEQVRIEADWSAPAAKVGDSFVLTLTPGGPLEFRNDMTFPLKAQDARTPRSRTAR